MCADGLIPEVTPPRVAIVTEAQATNYVAGLVDEMKRVRLACDVPYQGKDQTTVKAVQRMMWTFLSKQGQVVGALNAFRLTGMISERAYVEMHQSALNALIPTILSA